MLRLGFVCRVLCLAGLPAGLCAAEALSSQPLLQNPALHIEINSWQRPCLEPSENAPLECALPSPWKAPQSHVLEILLPPRPGQALVSKLRFEDQDLQGELRFYATFPYEESGLPPYIQIQIETFAPFRSLCLQSVRLRHPFEAPPTSCTGYDASLKIQRGLNLRVRSLLSEDKKL